MPLPSSLPPIAAAVQHRIASRLLDGFSEWWQPPVALVAAAAAAVGVVWLSRRDAADLPRPVAILLAILRLGAVAAVGAALLDIELIAEHEILRPSRVAVLVDSSASMSLEDRPPDAAATEETPDRSARAIDLLDAGGLLAALAPRHEVALWRFDADAEPLTTLPGGAGQGGAAATGPNEGDAAAATTDRDWHTALAPRGAETRIGEALTRLRDREPASLAGIVLLTDGGNNAGLDPLAAAEPLAEAGVAIHAVGLGSEILPTNARVADVVAPARVFPGDGFAVTAYVQAQGLAGERIEVELLDQPAEAAQGASAPAAAGRLIDSRDLVLAADGDLAAVRFEVPGLATPGGRLLSVRIRPPTTDHSPDDDTQSATIDVVDRLTQVLLVSGGPGRDYQFMRNALHRDPSFAVDVLLGTAREGIAQDSRRILAAFPESDEALAEYDAVVAIDADWQGLGPAAWSRLERWTSRASGGLVLVAGGIHMESWLNDPRAGPLRGLFPLELPRFHQPLFGAGVSGDEPWRLAFTPEGLDAEFLWLADSRGASESVWREFPGPYACFPATACKPGATIYAMAERPGGGEPGRIFLAEQYYGSGSVLSVGSAELWRLRSVGDASYERLVTQLIRHASRGRLALGGNQTRLLVDRDRYPVGGSVQLRLVMADANLAAAAANRPPRCRVVGPDGKSRLVPLAAEADRTETLLGSFIASHEGTWRIEVDPPVGGGEPIVRRVQVQLPDRELVRPRLDRPLLEQLAARTGGTARFPGGDEWTIDDSLALAAALPDRSRRAYETGVADPSFKQRLNGGLLAVAAGCLCLEWIVRRLVKLA